jgi:hypothetical protein
MTGRAGLPVERSDMKKITREMKRNFSPTTDLLRLTPDQESDLTALIIRTYLESGTGSRIVYETPSNRRFDTNRPATLAVSGGRIETTRAPAGAAGNTKRLMVGARFGKGSA